MRATSSTARWLIGGVVAIVVTCAAVAYSLPASASPIWTGGGHVTPPTFFTCSELEISTTMSGQVEWQHDPVTGSPMVGDHFRVVVDVWKPVPTGAVQPPGCDFTVTVSLTLPPNTTPAASSGDPILCWYGNDRSDLTHRLPGCPATLPAVAGAPSTYAVPSIGPPPASPAGQPAGSWAIPPNPAQPDLALRLDIPLTSSSPLTNANVTANITKNVAAFSSAFTFTAGVPVTVSAPPPPTTPTAPPPTAPPPTAPPPTAPPPTNPPPPAEGFVPVAPVRVLDTRSGPPIPAGGVVTIPLAGQEVAAGASGGVRSSLRSAGVPVDATAVVLNITGTDAVADGYVTGWPCGEPRPLASTLNLVAGATTPNLAIVKVGADTSVCLYTQSGGHLVVDLAGWFTPGSGFSAMSPQRVLDTRPGADRVGYSGDRPGPGAEVQLDLSGRGLPGDASAVVLNLTGTDAGGDGYVTAWPCGEARPLASNLNLTVGTTTPNLAIVKVGVHDSVCLYTQSGADLVADLSGAFTAGAQFTTVSPQRVLDTRPGPGQVGYTGGRPGAFAQVRLDLSGYAVPAHASSAVLNLTGTDAAAAGYVTAWPCDKPRPLASVLNLSAGETRPNLAVVKLAADDSVCLYTQSGTHFVADLAGWLTLN
jgi:hypothetical protein